MSTTSISSATPILRDNRRQWAVRLLSIICALSAANARPAAPGTSGCGPVAPSSGVYTIAHAGVTRSYRLSVPSSYNGLRPTRLIVVFHGWGGDESEFLGDPTVAAESSHRGYLVVAPRGIGS